ncbi:unnamed protein product, partial [Acanthocheilonema viteae]
GQCGSCYAFATAAALESYHKMKSRKLINLSPQNIVDCTTGYGNYGCDGGFMPLTFKYAMKYGIAKESNYPYVGVLQRCQWKQQIAVARDKGYMEVESGNELALQRAVAKYGPVFTLDQVVIILIMLYWLSVMGHIGLMEIIGLLKTGLR